MSRTIARLSTILIVVGASVEFRSTRAEYPFPVKPYVQLGSDAEAAGIDRVTVIWQTSDVEADWSLETRASLSPKWRAGGAPTYRRVAVSGIPAHRVYRSVADGLAAGSTFAYRVKRAGVVVFEAEAKTLPKPGKPYRAVVFGDCGAGTPEQRKVAFQIHEHRPDLVAVTGDIVYSRGRISEYRERFFPVYNADASSPEVGAPLFRSTLFAAAPGNHDILSSNINEHADLQAYFFYWAQPLNGPLGTIDAKYTPVVKGEESRRRALFEGAGPNYPRMANFSFDAGDAHWTMIDANVYVDWTDPTLRDWLARDLASPAARAASWRFVAFHQPGFNSSKAHFDEQRTRVLSEIFEQGGVSIVFAGHVHNYQRSYPLMFRPERQPDGKPYSAKNNVAGKWTLDKDFDGASRTEPKGVIYLVTGAGGAKLYNPEQENMPETWQEFTHKFVSTTHSFTTIDVEPSRLFVRQVAADGRELDRFTVTGRRP